ncbi:MAG TPA: hypothetical protein VMF12_10070 [Xanthobacteraceae bacterium]|nr:hypothetical protein [Xanthobacteraceae bacterium]
MHLPGFGVRANSIVSIMVLDAPHSVTLTSSEFAQPTFHMTRSDEPPPVVCADRRYRSGRRIISTPGWLAGDLRRRA